MTKAARAIVVHHQNILLIKRNKFGDEYYTLPGGSIEAGETAEAAALREVKEEASIKLAEPKLVYIEEPGPPFGTQYIFTANYVEGDARLDPDSIEAKLNEQGQNLYHPLWLPVSKLGSVRFVSPTLRRELLRGLSDGFPSEPKILTPG